MQIYQSENVLACRKCLRLKNYLGIDQRYRTGKIFSLRNIISMPENESSLKQQHFHGQPTTSIYASAKDLGMSALFLQSSSTSSAGISPTMATGSPPKHKAPVREVQ
jgi:hypothetical protein